MSVSVCKDRAFQSGQEAGQDYNAKSAAVSSKGRKTIDEAELADRLAEFMAPTHQVSTSDADKSDKSDDSDLGEAAEMDAMEFGFAGKQLNAGRPKAKVACARPAKTAPAGRLPLGTQKVPPTGLGVIASSSDSGLPLFPGTQLAPDAQGGKGGRGKGAAMKNKRVCPGYLR